MELEARVETESFFPLQATGAGYLLRLGLTCRYADSSLACRRPVARAEQGALQNLRPAPLWCDRCFYAQHGPENMLLYRKKNDRFGCRAVQHLVVRGLGHFVVFAWCLVGSRPEA